MKTKLTPERRKTIAAAIAAGNYKETAARSAGIGESTFYSWLERAEADIEQGKTTIYTEFLESIKKAESDAEVRNVKLIQKAGKENWQAIAWWLERSHPDKWGKRVQHTANITTQPRVDLQKLSNDDLKQIDTLLEKAARTG